MSTIAQLRKDVSALVALDEHEHASEYPDLRDRIISALPNIEDTHKSEVVFLIGYLYYLDPSLEDKTSATPWLTLSSMSQDSHIASISAMYLGHIEYDEGRYADALRWFESADPDGLDHDFLRGKLLEFRACCSIKTLGLDSSIRTIRNYVEALRLFNDANDIWPHELAHILAEAPPSSAATKNILLQLAREIDTMSGQDEWLADIVAAHTAIA